MRHSVVSHSRATLTEDFKLIRFTQICAVAMSGLLLAACSPATEDVATHDMTTHETTVPDQALIAEIVSDDVAYLTQLGLMRGHLFVGVTLYREGEHDEAATHMKHPESELYAELLPGLQTRGAADFAAQLETLAVAVETHAAVAQVDQYYEDIVLAINQAEATVTDLTTPKVTQVIAALLDNVVYEYGIAVDNNGMLVNAHEYQDCLGFVQVANGYIDTLQELGDEPVSIQGLRQQMAFLQQVFATTVPSPREPLTQPATVNEVVNRIGVTLAGFPL